MPFLDSLDIANRALQHLGAVQITSVTEDSKNNLEISAVYDKVRRAELRRNVWRFATRRVVLYPVDVNTCAIAPPQWSATVTYLYGAIVRDPNNVMWISLIPDNANNSPGGNNSAWECYYGSRTVEPWNANPSPSSNQAYYVGDLVYVITGPASYQVYMSRSNENTASPLVASAWSPATTYFADQIVTYSGAMWKSLLPLNLNNPPALAPVIWLATTTYTIGQLVTGSDLFIYASVGNGNIGNDPTLATGSWTNTNTAAAWSPSPFAATNPTSWLPMVGMKLTNLNQTYPIGFGPSSQVYTQNVYHLPAGFLRQAPDDPKAGSTGFLGAPSGLQYQDYVFEGNYLLSSRNGPLLFRFVADIYNVSQMDDMFCEGLAARVAAEACEAITNSTSKLQTVASAYKTFMGEARLVNGIETGPTEPPEDEYVTVRA